MIRIFRTCVACPEQYSVCVGDSKDEAAYVRLRHGHFALHIPHGNVVFERSFPLRADDNLEPEEVGLPHHDSDGIFDDDTVREAYLRLVARYVADTYDLDDAEFIVDGMADEDPLDDERSFPWWRQ